METIPQNISNLSLQNRYLISSIQGKKIAFLAHWIRDILIIKRSQILRLPFYNKAILGVIHDRNDIVTLVSTKAILNLKSTENLLQPTVTAVRLNESVGDLSGIGLVVDKMIETITEKELAEEKKFELTDISPQIWQPRY